MILKRILKSFGFQCDFDFDFQITTSKMIWILILNHLYLGDLILILKSSTYDDFAHLCIYCDTLKILEGFDRNGVIFQILCLDASVVLFLHVLLDGSILLVLFE